MSNDYNNIRLVSVKEAIEIMGIKRTKFYEEVKAGNIVLKKLGTRSLCPIDSIHKWIDSLPTVGGGNDQ